MPSKELFVIEVEGVGKSFRTYDHPGKRFLQALSGKRLRLHRDFWALRDISFRIKSGEVVGIIGRNGSGKSTLLQIIAGTTPATSGFSRIHGRVAALLELGTGFDPEESGRKNVIFNAQLLGMSQEQIDRNLDEIIEFAELGDFIDQPVKTYSSGMVVRLAFAINAHVDADVLIVDEALSVGDAAFQFKCLSRLDTLLSKGVTVLLVSHDVQLIKAYCNRAIYLRKGQVEFDGDCELACELYQRDCLAQQCAEAAPVSAAEVQCPGRGGLAFGNGKGRIQALHLCGIGAERGYFESGDVVIVEVVVQLFTLVPNPRITLVLRDIRGYNLYAVNNAQLGVDLSPDAEGVLRTRISFIADLQAGDYSLTLRLDNAVSDSLCELLDKQVGAISFRVVTPQKRFDAVVNLHGSFEVLSTS
ncbi:ABC transporter ATP-binding protein [Pseudomonas schmalbachii]|uniref:ABC transporter ATP-binding protein n=1 Tax=Pseudomonas schmalbachii TaxID=2816993 RepID=A0ABS3TLP4_9PSED|nr:ABC transporter ATP-binding protein [Pseudomonas schmalbachii]MBO3274587.1 ABC transporter ATP-binding protein [Pseudomonas schmalbachii]